MLSDWLFRARSLLRRAKVEEELDSEMRFHVARQVEAYIKAGLAPDEARRRARLEFGGIDQIKEECRDARGVRLVEEAWRDACYGARLLRRRPAFAWTIIAILALGIGANTLVFSVVNAVLLAPLPFRDAGRLVQIRETEPDWTPCRCRLPTTWTSAPGRGCSRTSGRRATRCSTSLGVVLPISSLATTSPPTSSTCWASTRRWAACSVRTRTARATTGWPLLSHALWQRKFGGDPRSIGAPIVLDGDLYTIIGVMPPAFDYPKDTELWVPLALPPDALQNRARPFLRLVGRLRAGVTVDQARATLGTLAAQLQREHPATNTSRGLTAVSLREGLTGDIRPALLVLLGFVGFILLAACANVATLLIVRAASREHEVTVRMALGAGWSRLVRQLVTESTLLAILGGSAGLALALGGAAWLPAMFPRSVSNVNIPRIDRIAIDLPVLAFTLCATLATALLFGLVPARHLARHGKDRRAPGGRERTRRGTGTKRSSYLAGGCRGRPGPAAARRRRPDDADLRAPQRPRPRLRQRRRGHRARAAPATTVSGRRVVGPLRGERRRARARHSRRRGSRCHHRPSSERLVGHRRVSGGWARGAASGASAERRQPAGRRRLFSCDGHPVGAGAAPSRRPTAKARNLWRS